MEIRHAEPEDVDNYRTLGRAAQTWLRSRGLAQYVPAAHEENAAAIRARVDAGTLYAATDGGAVVGFFALDPTPSPWWTADEVAALYLSGMVVDQRARGRGVEWRRYRTAWRPGSAGWTTCGHKKERTTTPDEGLPVPIEPALLASGARMAKRSQH